MLFNILQLSRDLCLFYEISEVDNKTKSSEPFLLSYVNNFLSFLLVVPVSFVANFVVTLDGSIRDDPYWTSRKNSVELRVIQ